MAAAERKPFRASVKSVQGVPTLNLYTVEGNTPVEHSVPIPELQRLRRNGTVDPVPETHDVDTSRFTFSFDDGHSGRGTIRLRLDGFNGPVAARRRVLEIKTRASLNAPDIEIRRPILVEHDLWSAIDIIYVESVRQQLIEREKGALREMLVPARNLMHSRRLLGNLRKLGNVQRGVTHVPDEMAEIHGPGNTLAEMLTGIEKKSAKQQANILKERITAQRAKYSLNSLRVSDSIRNEAIQMFPRLTNQERDQLYQRVIRNWKTAPSLRNPDGLVGRPLAIFMTRHYTPAEPADLPGILVSLIVNGAILDTVYPLYRIIHSEMLLLEKRPEPGDATTKSTVPDFLLGLEERTSVEQPQFSAFWNSQYRIAAGLAPGSTGGGRARTRRRTRRHRS